MKTVNRIIVVIVILSLVVLAGTTAQATGYVFFPDVPDGAEYARAVNFLFQFGIITGYPDGNFRPDELVTRAEFAVMISRLLGFVYDPANDSVSFRDVQVDHWAFSYIANAVEAGLVNGFGDGTYRPVDSLTYDQTIAILVRAYGNVFENRALNSGGWPNGYISVAKELDITDGVEITIGRPITRCNVAVLMYNAVKIIREDVEDDIVLNSSRYYFCGRYMHRIDRKADGSVYTWYIHSYDTHGNVVKEYVYDEYGTLYQYCENEYNANNQHVKRTLYRGDGALIMWFIYEYDAEGHYKITTYNEDGSVNTSFMYTLGPWT